MSIHPEIQKILDLLPPADHSVPDPGAHRTAEAGQVPAPEDRELVHRVVDRTASTDVGEIPVRVFTPTSAESHGIIVYFHGGAFFSGSLDTHDALTRALANDSGHTVISVDYRLAPENPYPAGLQDCYAVVRWASDEASGLGWNGQTLALAGDSSGGGFVAAVAAMAHDDGFTAITHQILYYPSVDLDFDPDRYASLNENAEGYGLETPALAPFNSHYLRSGANAADPLVSPIKRAELRGLPPAFIVTAEFDPLRDEGELYGSRLEEAGVPVRVDRAAGANHGFLVNFIWIEEYRRTFAETRNFLASE